MTYAFRGFTLIRQKTQRVCGYLEDGIRACERILDEGEYCPEHPDAPVLVEEYEPDMDWMMDESEVRGG